MQIVKTITLDCEDQTQWLAKQFASSAMIDNAFIALQGNLGAGKTTWARYLLAALGVQGRIKSPSYSVVESYELTARNFKIWHFDFYRFNAASEWEEAGFRDLFSSPGLKLVEWPNKVPGLMHTADVIIEFELRSEESRSVNLKGLSEKGVLMVQGVDG